MHPRKALNVKHSFLPAAPKLVVSARIDSSGMLHRKEELPVSAPPPTPSQRVTRQTNACARPKPPEKHGDDLSQPRRQKKCGKNRQKFTTTTIWDICSVLTALRPQHSVPLSEKQLKTMEFPAVGREIDVTPQGKTPVDTRLRNENKANNACIRAQREENKLIHRYTKETRGEVSSDKLDLKTDNTWKETTAHIEFKRNEKQQIRTQTPHLSPMATVVALNIITHRCAVSPPLSASQLRYTDRVRRPTTQLTQLRHQSNPVTDTRPTSIVFGCCSFVRGRKREKRVGARKYCSKLRVRDMREARSHAGCPSYPYHSRHPRRPRR